MKTLTRVPRWWSSEIIGFSHATSASRSHPWSEVTASGPSGTRVHCTGCAFRASSRNSGKGFPSMLNSTLGWSRNNSASSRTSGGFTCRWSGRGCTVIPWAPAAMHRSAASTTLGIPRLREFRSNATLFRLTLRRVNKRSGPRRASEHRAHADTHAPGPPFEEEAKCGAVALGANGELLYWLHYTHDLPSAGGHLL